MADAGVGAGSDDGGAKVGMALYNGPAYTEATFGAFKARAVPFNVNYRYRESELAYLLSTPTARWSSTPSWSTSSSDRQMSQPAPGGGGRLTGPRCCPAGCTTRNCWRRATLRRIERSATIVSHRRNHRHAQGCDGPQLAARRVWAHRKGLTCCPTRRRRRPVAAELRHRTAADPAAPMCTALVAADDGALSTGAVVR
jgi:hypothetical protein